MDTLFSDDDRQRIAAAIESAEDSTSGEIVPYVVLRSGSYDAVSWRAGVLGALAVLAAIGLLRLVVPDALPLLAHDGLALAGSLVGGIAAAFLGSAVAPATRLLAGSDRMEAAVRQRAKEAFVDEEIFATRDRTGILLFVSLLEHRIEVLADAGIYQQVDDAAWTDVTARIRDGIEAGHLTEGLIDAIERCGALLDEHGLDARPDDPDELSSHLRVRDE
jgi:putative membrane protein